MRHSIRAGLVLFVLLAVAAVAGADRPVQPPKPGASALTPARIFSSPEFSAQTVGVHWEDEGSYTVMEPSQTVQGGQDIVRYSAEMVRRSVVVRAEQLIPPGANTPLSVDNYQWSSDRKSLLVYTNSRRVWRQWTRGDYWVLNLTAGRLSKLGGDASPSTLMFAKFSPAGDRVGYVRENNLYVEDPASRQIIRLTSDGSAHIINGTFDWVYEEELDLRDGWRWSPDGRSIAYWQLDTTGVPEYTLVNDTAALYPTVTRFAYPKAGQTNSAARVGVVSAQGGPTVWMQIPGDPRNHYLARMDWAASPRELVIQQLNRLQNTDRVMLADAVTGQARTVFVDEDKAWVDAWYDHIEGSLHWLEGGRSFAFVSERDGWRHVYIVPREGGAPRLVTPGAFDVIGVERFDEARGWLYFIASPDNATQRYLYRALLNGAGLVQRLTPQSEPGSHNYDISPGGRWAVHSWSAFGVPPRFEMVRLPGHEVVRTLADNAALRERLAGLARVSSEFLKVDIGGGVLLDAWLMKPPGFDPTKRYPLLFFVYGEPWDSTVRDEWGDSDYLWHRMLAEKGYQVASVDNRGTNVPRGREWRKIVYHKLGVLPSADQAAAARWFQRLPYVDPARIGIWGWSGGGSMSLNAIFRYPKLYKTAMAVAPVPDMRYYDSIYQERYMGLPQEHPEDYRQGSPITFASQLEGNLLIVHGTGDDNVHYQGAEALINALIAANKPFTMMAYPNRTHGIFEGKGTTLHLYELLTRYLLTNLPPGPAPQ